MKRLPIYFFILAIFSCIQNASAQGSMKALWSYSSFYIPEKGPYVETYLYIIGSSLKYKQIENGKFQGKVSITLKIHSNEKVFYSDSYNLLSDELEDSLALGYNFIDQQRILLPEGKYEYELNIFDRERKLLAGEKPFESKGTFTIHFPKDSVSISDIVFLESYTKTSKENKLSKNGFDLVPLVDNYFPVSSKSIKFYVEIYNTKEILGEEQFLVSSKVQKFSNGKTLDAFSLSRKQDSKTANALMMELPIADLSSGNYFLEVEAKNKKNELLASKKIFFQRNNSDGLPVQRDSTGILPFAKEINNGDTLANYIKCLRPISDEAQTEAGSRVIKTGEIKLMQKYFTEFWIQKDSIEPDKAWDTYAIGVNEVNGIYKTQIELGCETDRGNVYLKYGRPSSISESRSEPSSYSYEIWHYYKIRNQSNRKFVFSNTSLSKNDYTLLHSDALGEQYDAQWELKLSKRNTHTNSYDDINQPSHFGGKANELFRSPK